MKNSIFIDTAFFISTIDKSDKYHQIALKCYQKLITKRWSLITTDAILIELGNCFAKKQWRDVAYKWIININTNKNIFKVVSTTTEIFSQAIALYGNRMDKEWGLTDCISFVVMKKYQIDSALTIDHHFEQAGFNIYMDIFQ